MTKALLKIQSSLGPVAFNQRNPYHKNQYADLQAVCDHLKPFLDEHEIVIHQRVMMGPWGPYLLTEMVHEPSGDFSLSQYPLPVDATPQNFAAAVTYARRYARVCMTGLIAEEDDDGNAASGKNTNGRGRDRSERDTGRGRSRDYDEDRDDDRRGSRRTRSSDGGRVL